MANKTLWVCISDGGCWVTNETGKPTDGPWYMELVVECGRVGDNFLVFEEYPGIDETGEPHGWRIDHFRELLPPIPVSIEEIISETV